MVRSIESKRIRVDALFGFEPGPVSDLYSPGPRMKAAGHAGR
jgi:hypothetical protein